MPRLHRQGGESHQRVGGGFFNGESAPQDDGGSRGRRTRPVEINAAQLVPSTSNDARRDAHAQVIAGNAQSMFDGMTVEPSAAAAHHRRPPPEAVARGNDIFAEYGTTPPPPAVPHVKAPVNRSDEELRRLLHDGRDEQRQRAISGFESTPSTFDRHMARQPLQPGVFQLRQPPQAAVDEARGRSSLMSSLYAKPIQSDLHRGIRVGGVSPAGAARSSSSVGGAATPALSESTRSNSSMALPPLSRNPITGNGVEYTHRIDKIQSKQVQPTVPPTLPEDRRVLPGPRFGTSEFQPTVPAPPPEQREGFHNWLESRAVCPTTDATFDPLRLKAHQHSPGDLTNHPHRMKHLQGPPGTLGNLLQHNPGPPPTGITPPTAASASGDGPARYPLDAPFRALGQSPGGRDPGRTSSDALVAGFRGLGDPEREARAEQRRTGLRHVPQHGPMAGNTRAMGSLDWERPAF